MIVVPKEIAFKTDGKMFIADPSNHLWLTKSKRSNKQMEQCTYLEINVRLMNDLMGSAQQLTMDPLDRLYYYLRRDGAVVRWNSEYDFFQICFKNIYFIFLYFSKPLSAENHDVLYFSPIPVVQIVFGAQGSVWVVEETANTSFDHCRRILVHYGEQQI